MKWGLLFLTACRFAIVNAQTDSAIMDETVISGTMKESSRSSSPISVEVYRPSFFRKNPTPNLFESMGMINGIRPQINCNVCNTGDIHINGMEGPYTMVLIDGMPLMSSLSTVYGLVGLPSALVEKIEVVKGPSSSLYGSEAMGGLINIITKNPEKVQPLSLDLQSTSWKEHSADIGIGFRTQKLSLSSGISAFRYQANLDKNHDGFTDVANQKRISIFNKFNLKRQFQREASIMLRYMQEHRQGGEINWTKMYAGSDSIYGESIQIKRLEFTSVYRLPFKPKLLLQTAWNYHNQKSWYGMLPFNATQTVGFAQLVWSAEKAKHSLLAGSSLRNTWYDDNTISTATGPRIDLLPGIFLQDEIGINNKNKILLGVRTDYHKNHGYIFSPRFAYKLNLGKKNRDVLRMNAGTGFRIVNVFTEDHAALTGSRKVVISENLHPEKSISSAVNWVHTINKPNTFLRIDISAFYTRFYNKILPDYSHLLEIRYSNLNGHSISQGASVGTDMTFSRPWKANIAVTFSRVYSVNNAVKTNQFFAPLLSGTWAVTRTLIKQHLTFDFTGQFYSPMHLPVLPNDFRPAKSPWFTLVNLNISWQKSNRITWYVTGKNLLNYVPLNPLMRPNDPFNKHVDDTKTNPNGYVFDTTYNFAPLQGMRISLGFRFTL